MNKMKQQGMQITPASIKDANAISALIIPLVEKYILPTCSVSGAQILLNSMNPESIEKYISAGFRYSIAIEQGELIAVVGMRDNSHLYHLFVKDSYQGKGLASLLWESAKQECLERGNKGTFTVNSAVNAVGMYRKFGFIDQSGVRERSGIKDIPMQLTFHLL